MYQVVTQFEFVRAFSDMGRMSDGESVGNFTYGGLIALFDWLEDNGDDGTELGIELDVAALCCDFSEYPSASDAVVDLQPDLFEDFMEEYPLSVIEAKCIDWLEQNTIVIRFDDGIIIHSEF